MDEAAARTAPVLVRWVARWLRRWLGPTRWHGGWIALAAAAGGVAGLAADALAGGLGSQNRHVLNLLAPPVWTVLAWNLAVYAALTWQALAAERRPAPQWAWQSASLLHAAAAGCGAGLIAGMYLRGLVFDYCAGWESTFLDATAVSAVLSWLLAPAAALTGVPVPDAAGLQALRVLPGGAGDGELGGVVASARPWIHWFAVTLALGVVLPRSVLAVYAGWRARPAARTNVPPQGQAQPTAARACVLPHAQTPGPAAVRALRELLATRFGDSVQMNVAPTVAYGDETQAFSVATDDTVLVLLFDLSATPETDTQGRLLQQHAGSRVPITLMVDEAAFLRRFGAQPERVAQRRAAWTAFAEAHGLTPQFVDLQPAGTAAP